MPLLRTTARALSYLALISSPAIVSACHGGASAPAAFIRTTNESGIWKQIEIRDELQRDRAKAWAVAVDALSSKYDLEVLDKDSGYLRSGWKFTAVGPRDEREHYRSRLVAKFNSTYTVLQLKSEAQWYNDGAWENGYDTQMLDDVYGDLQARLGRTRS